MRKIYIVFFFAFFAFASWGQIRMDQQKVLQKFIDSPDIQDFYKSSQLHVVMNDDQFTEVFDVSWNKKPVVFVKMSKIDEQHISSFFLIKRFQVSEKEGIVVGEYVYNYSGNIDQMVALSLKFQKNGQVWNVVSSELKQF